MAPSNVLRAGLGDDLSSLSDEDVPVGPAIHPQPASEAEPVAPIHHPDDSATDLSQALVLRHPGISFPWPGPAPA